MIRRPPRSTQSRSSAASDVYKRQALHGAEQDRARLAPRRRLGETRFEDLHRLAEDLAGHDEAGDEVAARLVVLADVAHAELAVLDDGQWVVPRLRARPDRVEGALFVQGGYAADERGGVVVRHGSHRRLLCWTDGSSAA